MPPTGFVQLYFGGFSMIRKGDSLKHLAILGFATLAGSALIAAAERPARYAVILEEPGVAARYSSVRGAHIAAARSYRDTVRAAQLKVEAEVRNRNLPVTGAVQNVLNAVFVEASPSRVAELRAIPGVKMVVRLHRFRPTLNRAVNLVNAPAAWNAAGGTGNAGAGVKIAVIDTGIDANHPAFRQAPPVPVPSGFPKCNSDAALNGWSCAAFTNSKVIVARSYIANGHKGDDFSPRDHYGHGTAVASVAAGSTNTGPTATITGMAPQAFLGSYKVFGTPGVNDYAGGDSIIQAVEDAFNDGMDIAVMSLGSPAFTGALDTGSICDAAPGEYCDPEAQAVETAVQGGMLVVAAAGNSGDSGSRTPSLNTIESPATAPSALAVGASTNSHYMDTAVRVSGPSVPADVGLIHAAFGTGPNNAVTGPLYDITRIDATGQGCSVPAPGALTGRIAIVTRGNCYFSEKVANAQGGGAVGVIVVNNTGDSLINMSGLDTSLIPAVFIGMTDGEALRNYVTAHTNDATAKLDPALAEFEDPNSNEMAYFSSRGPSITYDLKPELVAVGTHMYMAAETHDPNGILYDPSGYSTASGTSFSAPIAAGGAALVKQANPSLQGVYLKSAVVSTATRDVTQSLQIAPVTAMGNGKLDAGAAVNVDVTTVPATLSFGALGQTTTAPTTQTLTVHYSGKSNATLSVSVNGANAPALSKSSLAFTPGSPDQSVTLTLASAPSTASIYSGYVQITGGKVPIRVPYFYAVGNGRAYNAIPLTGDGFTGAPGQSIPGGLAFKVVDQYGVSVPNLPVAFEAAQGGGTVKPATTQTDKHGVAYTEAVLGPEAGSQTFTATAGTLSLTFSGVAYADPMINAGGVVSSASFTAGPGAVPGSYMSIFGSSLSDTMGKATVQPLPLAIGQASVTFRTSSGKLIPAPLLYADPTQINIQVPWEIAGESSVEIIVNVRDASSAPYSVPVAPHSPAIFLANGLAAAQDYPNYNLITHDNPAARGQVVILYLNGLGAVNGGPATGSPAPLGSGVQTQIPATVTIGGKNAAVLFSGLTDGLPGLNQINLTVPEDAPTGDQPIVVTIGGISSPAVSIPVR